ncbi:carboxylesterase family protein [Arundinibacter roseus]|uniref:Phospholipase n=1 Tax=Arundinibacter roseus TaxID=2070510 RepID=A0A4R4KH64_9BACT|nr:alpha/beta hydrolase-fold protein [Arundinibacter roseus]TDB65971.1 phospholipase [Arundinibacter roseus]
MKHQAVFVGVFVTLLSYFVPLYAQTLPAGPQVLTFHSDVDDTEQPYGLYLPKNFDPAKKYPFVLMLHGAGSNHRLSLKRVFGKSNLPGENDVEASRYFQPWDDVDFIVAAPFARGTMGYQGIAEQDVWDVVADVKKRFSLDENRMYLTGLSMGGGGTMWIGLTRPDVWAAIAPVCPAPPPGTESYVTNAFNYPVHFFQGGADPVVKPEGTREWVEKFKAANSAVEYIEFPGVQHNSWENAYQDEFIFKWFSQFTRNPFPNEVRFSTMQLKYNSAYWIKNLDFSPGTTATIKAKFTGKNSLEIKTENLDGLTLDLIGHEQFVSSQKLSILIDNQSITIEPGSVKRLTKTNKKWAQNPEIATAGMRKNSQTEGPLMEAVSGRHIYVYGTADNPSKEELAARRKVAENLADWATYRGEFLGRVMVFPRVLADREVSAADKASSHLILMGTAQSNKIVGEMADKLPFQLKEESTATHGLVYIFPNNNRYVLVNSGLPWWEMPDKTNNPLARLSTPGSIGTLRNFGDYLLFEKSNPEPIVSGRFANDWTLPAEQKSRLTTLPYMQVK